MWTFFLMLLVLVLALHAYRQYWFSRDLPQVYTAEFEGDLMKVGTTYIARKPAKNNSQRTIICFQGFLEDMRYFQNVYKDEEAELIYVNNANYHCPFSTDYVVELQWPENPYGVGSIEHDAFYVGLALERLANGQEVCLHGHSRGGAVVLETGRQHPMLMKQKTRPVKAILENPVVPQARVKGKGSEPIPHKIACYLLPIFFGLKRNWKKERLVSLPMMRPTNELKTELLMSIFCTARNYSACVSNVKSIYAWQRNMDYDVYENYPSLTLLIGERDDSLDRSSMLASAEKGLAINSGLTIIKTTGTNHFISLEQPEAIRALH
jgi:pimeloyl-ACP methyl ester carboxylesterase